MPIFQAVKIFLPYIPPLNRELLQTSPKDEAEADPLDVLKFSIVDSPFIWHIEPQLKLEHVGIWSIKNLQPVMMEYRATIGDVTACYVLPRAIVHLLNCFCKEFQKDPQSKKWVFLREYPEPHMYSQLVKEILKNLEDITRFSIEDSDVLLYVFAKEFKYRKFDEEGIRSIRQNFTNPEGRERLYFISKVEFVKNDTALALLHFMVWTMNFLPKSDLHYEILKKKYAQLIFIYDISTNEFRELIENYAHLILPVGYQKTLDIPLPEENEKSEL